MSKRVGNQITSKSVNRDSGNQLSHRRRNTQVVILVFQIFTALLGSIHSFSTSPVQLSYPALATRGLASDGSNGRFAFLTPTLALSAPQESAEVSVLG